MTPELSQTNILGSNFSFQHVPLRECFAAMQKHGRTGFELWGIAPHCAVAWVSISDARNIKREATAHGLTIACLTPEQVMYPVNIASCDNQLRDHSLKHFLRAAEIAAELETKYLFLTSGRGGELENREAAWRRSRDAIGHIVTRCEELGLHVLLEPLQRVESNLITTAAHARTMLDEVGSQNLGVTLDTVAMAAAGDTVESYFETLPDRVWHVHLVDGTPTGHLIPGQGTLPLDRYVTSLKHSGYTGNITLEIFGDGTYAIDPRTAYGEALETATHLLSAASAKQA